MTCSLAVGTREERGSTHGAEQTEDFTRFGEPASVRLAVDERSIGHDVEDAARTGDELGTGTETNLNGIRQTDGLRVVVSLTAVSNTHIHDLSFQKKVVTLIIGSQPVRSVRVLSPIAIP